MSSPEKKKISNLDFNTDERDKLEPLVSKFFEEKLQSSHFSAIETKYITLKKLLYFEIKNALLRTFVVFDII